MIPDWLHVATCARNDSTMTVTTTMTTTMTTTTTKTTTTTTTVQSRQLADLNKINARNHKERECLATCMVLNE